MSRSGAGRSRARAATAGLETPSADVPEDGVWTILRMILWSANYLEGKGVTSPRLDAEHLLAHVLDLDRLQLYLDFERPLTPGELDTFRPLLRRRGAREPLQYILGRQPFRELELEVDRAVLIPRPETELFVGRILAWARARGAESATALDVGTGTGAIALSLALEGPFASVVATDVAEDALDVARRNRAAADLEGRVELRAGSLFEPVGSDERFDVVASNPPYVAERDRASLPDEVRAWEPATALFGGPDGLDVIRRLAPGARRHLNASGLFALEVGSGQAEAVADLIRASGGYGDVGISKDDTGRERFVLAHAR